ncbi:MAG: hypothetical protein FJZ16_06385 [Candidatus Omnitrophica bacterium]|nr:hypothetical protein [Candidatus Omnitrophota bacterium]
MKAFIIGLIFLIAVSILAGICALLFPLLVVLAWFIRIVIISLFILFAIWLLGKFIIFVWESLRG